MLRHRCACLLIATARTYRTHNPGAKLDHGHRNTYMLAVAKREVPAGRKAKVEYVSHVHLLAYCNCELKIVSSRLDIHVSCDGHQYRDISTRPLDRATHTTTFYWKSRLIS